MRGKILCELCGIREVRKPRKAARHHFCHICGKLNPMKRLAEKQARNTFQPWYNEQGCEENATNGKSINY